MRTILIFMATALLAGQTLASTSTFGEAITLSDPITVEHAIDHIDKLKNKEMLIIGTVSKVCEKKGCWMVLKGTKSAVRVTFKDYAFFVPNNIVGKQVSAQGMLYKEIMSISEAKHFAKDAGQSDIEIQRIKQKTKEYRFIATAVKVTP